MAVSLNELLRIQQGGDLRQGMSLTYVPDLPPTPKAGMAPTYHPGGDQPPAVFDQGTDRKGSLRAQLQVDDPTTPAAGMAQLGRDWYDWRSRTLDEQFRAATDPNAPITGETPFDTGGIAGITRRALPRALPRRLQQEIDEVIERIRGEGEHRAARPIHLPRLRVEELERFWQEGKELPGWYIGAPQQFERQYGDLAPLSLGFNAAASMNATPYEQIKLANQGLRQLVESGMNPRAINIKGLGQVNQEMRDMAALWRKDPNTTLTSVFNPMTFKRTDYHDVMAGRRHVPVIDTHMGRVGYGLTSGKDIPTATIRNIEKNAWEWSKAKSGTARHQLMYRMEADVGTLLARHHGVEPENWQGQVWVPWREQFRERGGSEPLAQMLEERGKQSADYQYLVQSGVMKLLPRDARRRITGILGLMAGGGAAAGLSQSEAPPQ